MNDKELVRRQYATDEKLRIRQETHDKYTVPKIDFVEWALNTLRWRGHEWVLDVGCGPGSYFDRLDQRFQGNIRYIGVDLSDGMLKKHKARNRGVLAFGNAEQLPFADDSFDVVMANHMLYHVRDIESAIREFQRVLKPDGILMTTTNSTQTMPELQVLMRRAIVLLTRHGAGQVRPPEPASSLYSLESGTRLLARYFYAVVRHDIPNKLVFKDVEPAMDYLESTRDMREPQLPDDVVWEDVMMIMRQQIGQLINHLGELEINKLTGTLLATNAGDFIHDYVEILRKTTTTT